MCDEGPSATRIGEAYRAFKKLNPDFGDMIGALTFGDDKKFPQLQAADLMAGVGKEIGFDTLSGGVKPMPHRLASSIYFVRSWNQQIMLDLLSVQLKTVDQRL